MKTQDASTELTLVPLANRLFTIKQLCTELQVTRQTIRNWEKQGIITPKLLGGKKFFIGKDLIEELNKTSK
jgi:predicted site-specific integrase-resolvase